MTTPTSDQQQSVTDMIGDAIAWVHADRIVDIQETMLPTIHDLKRRGFSLAEIIEALSSMISDMNFQLQVERSTRSRAPNKRTRARGRN
jgi:hypothetical protein